MEAKKRNKVSAAVLAVGVVAVAIGWYATRPTLQPFFQEPGQLEYALSSGLPLAETNSLGMVFRLIPPGTYMRGSPLNERGRRLDERQHEIRISHTFYMGQTEVTQGQFEAIMGFNPSTVTDDRDRVPVDSMTFAQALQFCNRLSEREGLEPVYTQDGTVWTANHERNGYRLPLEAEWEYAARATTTTAFHTGPIDPAFDGRRNAWRAGWYSGNSRGRPREVAWREPNGWGLYDMLGNVWEYCWDWYADYPLTPEVNLTGPNRSNQGRVIRGGCWYDQEERLRAANRRYHFPADPLNVLGFRVARTVIPPATWISSPQ